MIKRFILIILITSILSGCATTFNPATGKKEIILINTSSEVSIGKSAAKQISKKYKISENKEDISRLKSIGQRVAASSDRQDLDYEFYIIEDDELNAFTIPGGHVYIHRGLYDKLDDDELAAVIGHEIGHVAARHIVKKMQAALGYQVLSTVALIAYSKNADEKEKKQAGYLAYAGATAFNLVRLGYSRKDEFEADKLGYQYSTRAGFAPDGMAKALEELKEQENKGVSVLYILRSHPYLDQRIDRLKQMQ